MRTLVVSLVLAVAAAGCGAAITPTIAPTTAVLSSAAPTAAPTAVAAKPTSGPTTRPTSIPSARPAPMCLASGLGAKVTAWTGGMGHRTASITLTNTSSSPCVVQGTPEVQLLGHFGRVLIDSRTDGPGGLPHVAPGDPKFRLARGATLQTLVDTDSYCGPAPALPTTVAFVLPSSAHRLVAAPGPGGDVPPCLRSPGSPGSISMNGWRR